MTAGKDEILSRTQPMGTRSISSTGPSPSAGLAGTGPTMRPSGRQPGTRRARALRTMGAASGANGW
ncbi:MAG: hypothetical protein M0C28_39455 [Candidatus Moduliflexus flocculans]|nr:hypothetical protein [Candidatus Moduliflexus flocculans]